MAIHELPPCPDEPLGTEISGFTHFGPSVTEEERKFWMAGESAIRREFNARFRNKSRPPVIEDGKLFLLRVTELKQEQDGFGGGAQ